MNYDAFLRWLSERGEGSLTAFRRTHDWLTAGEARPRRWTWTLQSLQSLGHIEVDWHKRRWEAAPSTIATMVSGGGYALLCGSRPRWFLRRLASLDTDTELAHLASSIVLEEPISQADGPSLQLVTLDEERDAAEVCAALGVEYSPFAADQLLHLLPGLPSLLRVGRRTGPNPLPGGVIPARMGAGQPGEPLFEEMEDPNEVSPGAYRMALFDTVRYFYVHSTGDAFEAGRGEVIFAELRRRGLNVVRWDESRRSLLVPARFRPPQLYERAAVLRTGLLPAVEADPTSQAKLLRYRNVNHAFADLLANKLGQRLASFASGPDARPDRTRDATSHSVVAVDSPTRRAMAPGPARRRRAGHPRGGTR